MLFLLSGTATTEIYTLSLHDALPISPRASRRHRRRSPPGFPVTTGPPPASGRRPPPDRKSTRLNSSHVSISYAVFCLKKKTSKHSQLPIVTLQFPIEPASSVLLTTSS